MSGFEKLLRALQDPRDEWVFDEYTCRHVQSNVHLWVANIPVLNIDTWPISTGFSIIERYKLSRALKVCRRNQLAKKLEEIAD